jgi:hypothetical protein
MARRHVILIRVHTYGEETAFLGSIYDAVAGGPGSLKDYVSPAVELAQCQALALDRIMKGLGTGAGIGYEPSL